jgi:hypothetical protein
MNNHQQLWNQFCTTNNIATNKVPLFETSFDLAVKTKQIGKPNPRNILCRSPEMDTLIRAECAKLIDDWKQKAFAYDGLIYMMLAEEPEGVVPLYIGKAETLGKKGRKLSDNIKGVRTSTWLFARWGDNYAYHIGDLSAAVLQGYDPKSLMISRQRCSVLGFRSIDIAVFHRVIENSMENITCTKGFYRPVTFIHKK